MFIIGGYLFSQLTDQNFLKQVARGEEVEETRPPHLLPILVEVGEEGVGGNMVHLELMMYREMKLNCSWIGHPKTQSPCGSMHRGCYLLEKTK